MRADAMLGAGDLNGSGVWKRALKAGEKLLPSEPKEAERVT